MVEENEHIEDLQIRSDEVQEILSHVPNWMIRWGITLIFILLGLFLFLSWMIKYPDKIVGTTTLTKEQPPIKLITKTAGEIETIHFEKNATVHENDEIAVIQSTLSQEARNFLKDEITNIQQAVASQTLAQIHLESTEYTFGELQANYVALTTAIKNYQYLINKDNTAFNIANASKQIKNQQNLQAILKSEVSNNENLLKNAEKKYESDKVLYQKGVISQAELFERQKTYESAVSQINSLKQSQISTEISITDLQKQLNDLQFNYNQKKKDFLLEINNQLSTIENTLSTWQRSYEIKSPMNGKLVYLENVVTNDYVESGKALFAVVPENQNYIAYLKIPKTGFGKVKLNQKVMLKIDNYPYQEYGQLLGKVNHISLIANEDNYLVQVKLTNGLKTTYNKEINYAPEMSGTAEIITEDLRIIDRIFNQFRKVFDN